MPEYPLQHLAQKFHNLFQGNQNIYGRTELTGEVDNKGKHVARSWTVKEPVTEALWLGHLKGDKSIGQVPVRADGTVTWIAFDVDIYKGQLNVSGFLERIEELKLPIILTRSKSGGAHALIFFSEPVDMESIRPKIQEMATFFEIGGCEIFPKQDRVGPSDIGEARYGNWLNMPYDGPSSLRYGYKKENEGYTPSEFADRAEALKITQKDFLAIEFPKGEQTLEDGPPCLNYLTANKMHMTGGRNVLLFNLGTYHKKRFPEATKEERKNFLLHWNGKFNQPLEEKEIKSTILKSLDRKEYHYQCGIPLLKNHCDSEACKKCLFGIDGDENAFDPNNKSLIQMLTDPPIYFLSYHDVQIRLSRDELWSYEQVRKACMDQAHHIPPKMDQEHWLNLVQGYLESVTIIELPPETTGVGQLIEIISNWYKRATMDTSELCNGKPVLDKKERLVFRFQDLKQLLKMEQFKALPDNRITEVIQNNLMGDYCVVRADNKSVRAWRVDVAHLSEALDLSIKEPKEPEENF